MKSKLFLFLERLPVAHALARACECQGYSCFKLKPPVLDIGCGDGTFARICFGCQKIKAGVDINPLEIQKAKRLEAYQEVFAADICRLPFKKEKFATVIANSTLEHVENIDLVLKEACRVLKKGGQFIFTVPTPWVGENYLFTRILRKFGLTGLADWYIKTKNRFWHHINLKEEKWWRKKLARAGFFKVERDFIGGGKVTALCDLMGVLALPGWILKKFNLVGQFKRPKFWVNFWSGLLEKWPEYKGQQCSTFLFKAVKK